MTLEEKLKAFEARMQERKDAPPEPCQHVWGTAYKSSSGRKVCVKCNFVTGGE